MSENLTKRERIYEYYTREVFPKIKNLRGSYRLRKLLEKVSGRDKFTRSDEYWENRYREGKTSGRGSYGEIAEFKANFLNNFVKDNNIESVIEFGCGDGNQLEKAEYPEYIGLDVARESIEICKNKFNKDKSKSFFLYEPDCFINNGAIKSELGLSLDVIFHLVEDEVFEKHIEDLFASSKKYVIIYSTNEALPDSANHVKHRKFTEYINNNLPNWKLTDKESSVEKDKNKEMFVFEN